MREILYEPHPDDEDMIWSGRRLLYRIEVDEGVAHTLVIGFVVETQNTQLMIVSNRKVKVSLPEAQERSLIEHDLTKMFTRGVRFYELKRQD